MQYSGYIAGRVRERRRKNHSQPHKTWIILRLGKEMRENSILQFSTHTTSNVNILRYQALGINKQGKNKKSKKAAVCVIKKHTAAQCHYIGPN